ncbi:MAG: hypothetical protein COC01_07315 [Bacteroidetes bacterium]|nr:MAG: hypothetical protein COC01_07315 [Bacteroidota bacterium]
MILALITMSYNMVFTYSSGSPTARTGAPGEGTCNAIGCHSGNSVTTGGSIAFGSGDTSYTSGTKYTVTVTGENGTINGFEIVAMNSSGTTVGTVTITDATNTQTATGSSDHVTHTFSGTSSNSWSYDWTAPSTIEGDITFYTAVNKGNGGGTAAGDFIFTNSLTIKAPPNGIGSQSFHASNNNQFKIFPNPTTSRINLSFELDRPQIVKISLVNIIGKEVVLLENREMNSGKNTLSYIIDNNLPRGIYLINISSSDFYEIRKLNLI